MKKLQHKALTFYKENKFYVLSTGAIALIPLFLLLYLAITNIHLPSFESGRTPTPTLVKEFEEDNSTPSPSKKTIQTPTPTKALLPSSTPTSVPTSTPTLTPTPTNTPQPTPTPTLSPTEVPTHTPTPGLEENATTPTPTQ